MTQAGRIAWYSTAAARPPAGVVVFVRWSGRPPFEASHVRHPREKRMAWLVDDNGKPVFLPTDRPPTDPKRPWAGWHTLKGDPDYWRPKYPEKWQMPLPEPALVEDAEGQEPKPRMWSSTTRFGAVEDAEAEDLAREMEGMRADARAAGRKPDVDEYPELQWWLDPLAITYSPTGKITLREAEGRLMRAFAAERWVTADRPSSRTFGDVLAQLAKNDPLSADELAASDPVALRIEPTGKDRDDMLTALAWRHGLSRDEYAVLELRSQTPPLTWSAVGRGVRRSHRGAQALYKVALNLILAEANGSATSAGAGVRQRHEDLRARNRAFKRGE